jgi:murein DD-endopeptidase MepM/ murein hydrolase activator NlpD
MTWRRGVGAAVAVSVGLVVAAIAASGGAERHGAEHGPAAQADASLPPLKPHPRVVIAVAPGDVPPDAQFTYGEAPEAQDFKPPSDAEVKRELGQLRVAKLSGSGDYVDPLSQIKGLTPERIDMGVDYQGSGPILALGDGTVFNTAGPGWPGGAFVGITLSAGPFAGLSYFVAEDVKPTVRVGDHVRAGQEIAVMFRGPAGIETGWATGHGDQPLAAALGQQNRNGDPGAWSSAAGVSFDRVLVAAGTPSGIPRGPSHGRMPAAYP